jgi:hypothetical protein
MNPLEELRHSFRPERITALFVGESAPASGKFFYSGNSSLFREMKKAFGNADSFLDDFKRKGFYLDDLSLTPINKLSSRERNRHRREAIAGFAERLSQYKPNAIVIVMRAIVPMIREAMHNAGISYEPSCVSHPAFGNSRRFQSEMMKVIPQLLHTTR